MKAIINYKNHIIHDAEIKTISKHIVSFYLKRTDSNNELIAYIVERIINEDGSITCIDDDTFHIVLEKRDLNEIIAIDL